MHIIKRDQFRFDKRNLKKFFSIKAIKNCINHDIAIHCMEPEIILIIDEEFNEHRVEKDIILSTLPSLKIIETDYSFKEAKKYFEDTIGIISQIYADIDSNFLSSLPKLKAISIYGGGYDRVDIQYANENNIKVSRVPDYCNDEVAEYVITCIMNFSKKLNYLNLRARKGFWGAPSVSEKPIDSWNSEEMENLPQRVSGTTLLLIGYGKIGKSVARKATGIGMKVFFYDPAVKSSDEISEKIDLDDGLKIADFVSINTTLNDSTRNLINYSSLSRMKKTAYLINSARGQIVNEDDLARAIDEKLIRGAALDVVREEPLDPNSRLYGYENIFITPHSIYVSEQSMKELKERAAKNLIALLKGEKIKECVNC